MFNWYLVALLVIVAGATVCLLGIWRSAAKLAKGIGSLQTEIAKMNAKLTSVETVNKDDAKKPTEDSDVDTSLEALEAAISNFEKLKRIDLTDSQT